MKCLLKTLVLFFVFSTPFSFAAERYPVKSLRFVVPFPPGGGTDAFARIVAAQLTEIWGQQIVIDNRSGAQGNVGTALGAPAEPDGYTITIAHQGALTINPHLYGNSGTHVGFDTLRDFAPVSRGTATAPVLSVHPSVTAKTLDEVVLQARRNPGKLSFASTSSGQQMRQTLFKIVDVKVQCYSYPTPPLRGTQFGTIEEATIVRVQTDEGLEGYGVARAVGGASGRVIADGVIRTAKPRILGEDPFQRERVWQRLWSLDRGSHLQIFATSVIDVALWDLAGKALNAPVWKLLGGYREKVPAYASSARLATEEDYAAEALLCRSRGYSAYKLHPFADPVKDVRVCRAVREAVGPDMALMLDASCEYDHEQALRVGREIEKLNFYWYEEPINAYDLRGYTELCRALEVPVVAAEMVAGSIRSTAQYIAQGAGDILRADVYWRGGITAAMKTAHLCEAFGIKTELHHGGSPLMDVATLHCACAMKNCEYVEVLVPEAQYQYGLKQYPQVDAKGNVHAPSGAGLGVEIDSDYIENHTTFAG